MPDVTAIAEPKKKLNPSRDPLRLREMNEKQKVERDARLAAAAAHTPSPDGVPAPPPPVPATGNLAWKRRVLIRLGNRSKSDIARVQAIRLLAQLDGELVDRSEDVTESPAERLERERIAWSLMTPVPEPDDVDVHAGQ